MFVDVTVKELIDGLDKDKAWKVISDFESFPSLVECIVDVKVGDEVKGNEDIDVNKYKEKSHWLVDIDGAPLNWIQIDNKDKDNYRLEYESIYGDFDSIKGYWQVNDNEIVFHISYDLGIPVIEEVLGHILKEKVTNFADIIIKAIKGELTNEQRTD